MAQTVLKAEFQKSRLFYGYHDNRVFYSSHWKLPHPMIFVLVRLLLSAYSIFALIHYFVELAPRTSLMIFFTTWSYILLSLHLALTAMLSVLFYRRVHYGRIVQSNSHDSPNVNPADSHCIEIPQRSTRISAISKNEKQTVNSSHSENKNNYNSDHNLLGSGSGSHTVIDGQLPENSQWYFKLSWCLGNINLGAAPLVTSIYFAAIYPSQGTGEVGLIDTNVHLLNTVFVVIDFLLSARPVRLLHVLAPGNYGLCWIIFSIIYWSTDHQNHIVYKMIDWNKPGLTMVWTIGLLVLIIVLQMIFFTLYRAKLWLYTLIHKEEYFVDVQDKS